MRGQWLVSMAGVLVGLVACEGKHREFASGPLPGDGHGVLGDAGEQLGTAGGTASEQPLSGDGGATLPIGSLEAACTGEGDGEIVPCGLPPACDPAASDCIAPCPGCLIEGECVGLGSSNPGNVCQICDPQRDSADWSSNDGVQCDDGLYCTVEDVCGQGVCAGAERACEDGIACNGVSECDEEGQACSPFANQCGDNAICDTVSGDCVTTCEGCTIAGSCVQNGAELAGNPCMVCNTAQSRTAFTPAVGRSCGSAAGTCSLQDTCDAAGVCQPNHSPSGSACGSNASSECDQSDACDGNGACLQRRVSNATPCEDGLFCTTGDECQGGSCIPLGSRNCGPLLACNENADQCQCQGCQVGSSCFASGAVNPANPCQVCDPSRNAAAFSSNTNALCGSAATECSGQDTCNAQGQCVPNHVPNNTRCGASLPASCINPDLCNGQGVCQSRSAQRVEACDGQDNDCDGTNDEGFNLATDSNNCGACNHSCLGAPCRSGLCQPTALATGVVTAQALAVNNTDVYWGEGINQTNYLVRRIARRGGNAQTLVSGRPGISSIGLSASQMYWNENDTTARDRRIMRANLDGTGVNRFTAADSGASAGAVFGVTGGFVYWHLADNNGDGLARATAVTGNAAAPMPLVLRPPINVSGNIGSISNGCFVYVTGNTILQRTCEGSSIELYSNDDSLAGLGFAGHSTDADFAYFFEGDPRILRRIRLNGSDAGRPATVASVGAQAFQPVVDGEFVYYFRKAPNPAIGNDGFACTDGWSLERVNKAPGSQPVTLVPPSQSCPTLLVADNEALYWAVGAIGEPDGAIMRLAK